MVVVPSPAQIAALCRVTLYIGEWRGWGGRGEGRGGGGGRAGVRGDEMESLTFEQQTIIRLHGCIHSVGLQQNGVRGDEMESLTFEQQTIIRLNGCIYSVGLQKNGVAGEGRGRGVGSVGGGTCKRCPIANSSQALLDSKSMPHIPSTATFEIGFTADGRGVAWWRGELRYSCVACLDHLTIDRRSRSKRSTGPTPNTNISNVFVAWGGGGGVFSLCMAVVV